MGKIVKFVVLPVAGIVVVLGAVAAYVAATFDPNQYKPQIIQAVKDKTQRTLRLDGDIKLSFFTSIGATLGKISLSERGNEKEFAGMDEFRASLKLMPLLSKQVVVDAVEIKNLRTHLVRYKDGKTNIDDLTGRDKTTTDKEVGSPVSIDIDHVTITNATITLADQAEGAKYSLSKLNVKTGRIAPGVPGKIDVSFVVQSDKPKLNLDTAIKTTLTFDLEKQHFVVDGLDLSAKGLGAGISDLVANVKGNVDANPASKVFVVSKLVIAATGKKDGGDLNFKLDVPALNVTKEKVKGENISLDARMNEGKGRMTAKLDIPAIDGNAQAFRANDFMASVEMHQPTGATIKAKLNSPLTGSVDAEKFELAKMVITLNINNPTLPKNPIDATITGSAQMDAARQQASLTFATKLDDSTINGKAGLSKFTPPSYTFDVSIDQLDADRYLPKTDPKQKKPEEPFDLAALKGLNANGSIRIGKLKVSNVSATNVRLDVKAANGRADVSPVAANLYQGTLNGAVSLQAGATPVISIKQNLSGVSVGPLLKDAANFETLDGKGNISIDVTGQGNTVSALKKSLNGNGAIALSDGSIKGIDLAGTIRNAKAKLGMVKGEQTQAASKTEKTDFSELGGTFTIKNGVAHNSDLSGKSPLLRLGGEGDIDIGNEQLNYQVKATVVASLAGQGGQGLTELKGVTVPVRLTGPFTAPEYKIDYGGIATSLAQAAVEGRKEEIKAKVQDKVQDVLKDRLKGLFGR